MSLVLYIVGATVCAVAGAGVCAMILNSRTRRREDARRREAEAQLEKTRAAANQEIQKWLRHCKLRRRERAGGFVAAEG